MVAEIEFAGWTADGQVRQAAFKGLREDKPAREVEAEKPAKPAATDVPDPATDKPTTPKSSKYRRGAKVDVMGVLISSPDKAPGPDAVDNEPVMKVDLAQFYEAVGPWLIEHIRGRPCSIVRTPDGIAARNSSNAMPCRWTSNLIEQAKVKGDKAPADRPR